VGPRKILCHLILYYMDVISANLNPFMMFQRELMKKQIEKLKNQKEKLESLCRSLQAERKQGSSGNVPDITSNEADLAAPSQGS
jgi:hypothetical protein